MPMPMPQKQQASSSSSSQSSTGSTPSMSLMVLQSSLKASSRADPSASSGPKVIPQSPTKSPRRSSIKNGVLKFNDGRVFQGSHIRGYMIQGKMTYRDGSIYEGSWIDGKRHGKGRCIFPDGGVYLGDFREGDFHGQGKMTWSDGGSYAGAWCFGEMHGHGVELRPYDGTIRHKGVWQQGVPVRGPQAIQASRKAAKAAYTTSLECRMHFVP
jgi:hypothetical protein